MKIRRSLTALILSFGFLFAVMSLLGGSPVPIAQAAPPTHPALAPLADPSPIGQTPLLTLTGEAASNDFGDSVASAGDVNGDGFADALVGAFGYNSYQGRAYLYLGSTTGLSATPTLTLTGEAASNYFGYSVAPAGDVNGDGFADALVGAYGYNGNQGRAYLYLGNTTGLTATPALTLTGEIGNVFGISVASAGDVNGDGYADTLVGAYGYNGGQGRAYLYLGNTTGLTATPALTLTGEAANNYFGISVASAGDVNGDGFADVIIGAFGYNSNQGRAYLYLGNTTSLAATPILTLTGEATYDNFGYSVASAGDVNGDGYADALVGAYSYNSSQGRAYLYLGNTTGLTPTPALTLTGETTYDDFGSSVASAGDVNGDGFADALISADGYNDYQGRAYLYLGNTTGLSATPALTLTGEAMGDWFGRSVASPGDVNDDGFAEVLVGAIGYNSNQGRAYLYGHTPAADLVITKTASPEPVIAGTTMFYTITVANQGTGTATNVVVSDTLPPSTTLITVDQIDDDGSAFGFGGGTHQNTHWIDPRPAVNGDETLSLIDPLAATGVFTSRAIDAGNVVSWTSLAWTPQRPYSKPLPNNRGVEADYPLGDANMLGNRVLLHLDEAAGSMVFTDTSGLNRNGLCPATTGEGCPTAGSTGRFNQALNFDGALSQTVTISDAIDPARYAIELWVNPSVVTDTSFILRTDALSGTLDHYSQLLGISGDRFVHLLNDGRTQAITSTTIVTPNTWYHVVGTAESNGDMKLYVNGELQATLNGLGPVWAGGDQYRLGSSYGPTGTTRYFSGRLDEVAIYTRTLSAGEVLDHYLRGALRLGFEVRSCDDALCAGEAFGSTIDSEQSNATLGLPSVALNGVPDNRYFQYRATLVTDDPDYAPALHSVIVDPSHLAITASQGNCAAPVPAGFSCALGNISVGGLVTITTEVFVDPSALGIITNTAFVTATSPITNPLDDATFVTTTVIARANLSIDKYNDYDRNVVNPGSVLTYHLDVYNAGPSTALTPTITDTLPASMIGSAWGNGWTCLSGNTITCTRPSLNVYQWSSIHITATAPLTLGLITNTAWISSPVTPDPNLGNNSDGDVTLVVPLADLVIEKIAQPDPVDPGATLTYTINVTNTGPYTATNVIVTDTLPIGFTGYPIGGADWSCGAPGNVVICSLLTPLTSTFSAHFNITLTAPVSGFLMNMAEVSSAIFDPEPDNNVAIAYTAVRRVADLSIVKSDNPDPVEANATLTYTLSITNAGPVSAGVLTNTYTFANPRGLAIPWTGRAAPYPSNLYLSSVEGVIQNITVTLNNFSHTYPGDVSALLVGPGGQNVMLMSNAIGGTDVNHVTLRFNEAGVSLPLSGTITSTVVYRPTSYGLTGDLADPAPAGPYGGNLSAFRGASPNGLWQLYVYDNVDSDGGAIADGWSLQLTSVTTDTVNVIDTLPIGVSFINATGAGWLCNYAGSEVGCEVGSLPIGRTPDITLVITAPMNGGTPLFGDIITNTASITSTTADFTPGNNTSTITTTVLPVADLSIAKAASGDPIPIGTIFTYTLTISNAGPSTNLPITVTDVLPINTAYLSHSAAGWACVAASGVVTCNAPSMAIGTQTIQIVVTAPLVSGVITNTASIASTARDPNPLNNTATLTTMIADIPIGGLTATNNSPTVIGHPTTFHATISVGSNVTYVWDFGDGTATVSGNPVTHIYAAAGIYMATVRATNSVSVMTATTQATIIPFYTMYLPVIMRNYAYAPDLVVSSIDVTSNTVRVVIKNQGPADVPVDVAHEFWVDLYVNPNPVPVAVNDVWNDGRSLQGAVWGVTVNALPSLRAGGSFTLTLGDAYYWPTLSTFPGGLAAGTPLYAQVDSAHTHSVYGAVLENHELSGGPYNNISGPVLIP